FTQTLILLTVLYGLRQHSGGSAVWILVGIALAGLSPIETIASWLIIGIYTGILLMLAYRFVFRHEPQILLITTAIIVILSVIRDGVQRMYPSAFFGAMAGAVLVAITAWAWFRGTIKAQP